MKNKTRCIGCYDNIYNNGAGGETKCFNLDDAKIIYRKKVNIHETPEQYNNRKYRLYPDCYREKGYVFLNK